MLRKTLRSCPKRICKFFCFPLDIRVAKAVVAYDDVVDGYFKEIKDMLIDQLRSGETDGETLVDLLMIVKYLEKIGDHAVNIAGWVIFSITGQHERIE